MKGCTLVTDHGISRMILKCKELCSILACDTSFGNHSALALCSGNPSKIWESEKYSQLMAYKLLTLHIGRCRGILVLLQFLNYTRIINVYLLFAICPTCLMYCVSDDFLYNCLKSNVSYYWILLALSCDIYHRIL